MAGTNVTMAQLLELVKAMGNANTVATVRQRTFQALPALNSETDLSGWEFQLTQSLMYHGLEDYIKANIQPPAEEGTPAFDQWRTNNLDIQNLMMASVKKPEIRQRILNLGWKADGIGAYGLYQKIIQALQRGTFDIAGILLEEYFTLKRANFASFQAYFSRLEVLRRRLDTMEIKIGHVAHLWAALNGIKTAYPDLYDRLARKMEDGTMTWSLLCQEYSAKAVTEETTPAHSKITIETTKAPAATTPSPATSSTSTKKCDQCTKGLRKGNQHCMGCGRHHPKGKACWWCDPDKAPKDWEHREKAQADRQERRQSTGSSTGTLQGHTGGVTNTGSSRDRPAHSTLMLSNNFANISLPTYHDDDQSDFRLGPQRQHSPQ